MAHVAFPMQNSMCYFRWTVVLIAVTKSFSEGTLRIKYGSHRTRVMLLYEIQPWVFDIRIRLRLVSYSCSIIRTVHLVNKMFVRETSDLGYET